MKRLCPTPRKVGYRSRVDAVIALWHTSTSDDDRRHEKRAYRCPCGRWHLTSKPARSPR